MKSSPTQVLKRVVLWLCLLQTTYSSADENRPPVQSDAKRVPADHAARAERGTRLFKSEVRSILTTHCLDCHGGKATKAEFDLSTREALLESGYLADSADESYLVELIQHASEPHMPWQADRLSEASIASIREWIDLGAPYDQPLVAGRETGRLQAMVVTDEDRRFWAFQPLRPVPVPAVKDARWCRTPIDHFILARQEAVGLAPNPQADKRTLIRRASFDLLGLPAGPDEVDEFVASNEEGAWKSVIERFMESEHFGERWARHWMDVARFAESHGYEQDYDRPHAYHYRDFLIQAFNSDLPFDRFVQWQLAGDEMAPDDPLALMATGFLGAGAFPTQLTEAEFESARYDELDDMVTTTGVAFLGLSVGCARCHDHKFDPIPSSDYYRMAATFTTAIRSEMVLDLEPQENRRRQQAWDAQLAELQQRWDEQIDASACVAEDRWRCRVGADVDDEKTRGGEGSGEWKFATDWFAETLPKWRALNRDLSKHREQGPQLNLTTVMVTSEGLPHMKHHADGRGFPHFYPETYHLARGDIHQKQEVAVAGFLQVLTDAQKDEAHWRGNPSSDNARTSFRRSTLANWMTDAEYGAGALLARVIVNRVWQHHFGVGLVSTPNDFGLSGERPSHPELLEWLAKDLVEHGWQLKRLHRLILSSSVYMQSAATDESRLTIDRENRLLWRWTPRRLEAEAIRDSLLAVSGMLDRTLYGPGTLDESMTRRSIYFFIKRSRLIPTMMLFDWPEHLVSIGQRASTTIAPQALVFLNSPQGRRYAEALAMRLPQEEIPAAIVEGYRLAFARAPTAQELTLSSVFLEKQVALYRELNIEKPFMAAMSDLCQALLGMNEFVYIE